jgi:hypothetical protein
MWVYNGDCSRLIGNDEAFRASDGTSYSGTWDKATVAGMQEVVLTPEPSRPGYRVTGNTVEMIGGIPTRVWFEEPIPPVVEDPNDAIKHAIFMAEQEITGRRIREAVLGMDGGWLSAKDAEIVTLRRQLK